jgi:iron complex transport system substrate-binding protein
LQPSATVILAALGKLDLIVGCTKYCADVCPGITSQAHAVVSDSWAADSQQITAVKSDLVIASVPYQVESVTEILKSGARFLGLAPKNLADIYEDIACIGGIVGAVQPAELVIAEMRARIEAVRQKTETLPKFKIFCEEWGKPLIASQPWVAELIAAAGGVFVGPPGKQISPAEVLAADPDLIVAAWCGAGDRVPLEKIIKERNWLQMSAVKSGLVYCIRDEFLNTPAPTLLSGLDALAAAIHPQHFVAPTGIRRIIKEKSA